MGEIVSDTKFFIDLGALNSQGRSTGAASRLLTKVKKVDRKDDRKAEVMKAGGVKQGAGFRRQQGGGSLTLTVYRETGTPEVDWLQLQDDEKVFTFTLADERKGQRVSYTVTVSNIDGADDENGTHEYTVVLVYTKRYRN